LDGAIVTLITGYGRTDDQEPPPSTVKAGGKNLNHNETLRVRSTVKAGGVEGQHNEALRHESDRPVISMRRQPQTTGRKEDRLELLVVRAGLRAGRRARHSRR
jgi:hypothetical protein